MENFHKPVQFRTLYDLFFHYAYQLASQLQIYFSGDHWPENRAHIAIRIHALNMCPGDQNVLNMGGNV